VRPSFRKQTLLRGVDTLVLCIVKVPLALAPRVVSSPDPPGGLIHERPSALLPPWRGSSTFLSGNPLALTCRRRCGSQTEFCSTKIPTGPRLGGRAPPQPATWGRCENHRTSAGFWPCLPKPRCVRLDRVAKRPVGVRVVHAGSALPVSRKAWSAGVGVILRRVRPAQGMCRHRIARAGGHVYPLVAGPTEPWAPRNRQLAARPIDWVGAHHVRNYLRKNMILVPRVGGRRCSARGLRARRCAVSGRGPRARRAGCSLFRGGRSPGSSCERFTSGRRQIPWARLATICLVCAETKDRPVVALPDFGRCRAGTC